MPGRLAKHLPKLGLTPGILTKVKKAHNSSGGEPKNSPVLWIGWQTGQPDVNWGLAHPRSLKHTIQVKVEGLRFLLMATPAAEFVSKYACTGSTGDSYDAKIPQAGSTRYIHHGTKRAEQRS